MSEITNNKNENHININLRDPEPKSSNGANRTEIILAVITAITGTGIGGALVKAHFEKPVTAPAVSSMQSAPNAAPTQTTELPVATPQPNTAKRLPSAHKPRPAAGTTPQPPAQPAVNPPVVAPVAPQVNQGIINNAPNSGIQNTSAAGSVCDQRVNLEPRLPAVRLFMQPLPPVPKEQTQSNTGEQTVYMHNPGAQVAIEVSNLFQDPAFRLVCDTPCVLNMPILWTGMMGHSTSNLAPQNLLYSTSMTHEFALQEPMYAGSVLKLIVRSWNSEPIKNITIVPLRMN